MQKTPTLYVFAGKPGVGKSTAIDALTGVNGGVVHSSDEIRKELFDPVTYSGDESEKTYTELYERVEKSLNNGRDAVIDATMGLTHGRERAEKIASDTGANIVFVKIECPEDITKERIRKRAENDNAVSDADVEVYENFEFDEFERSHTIITNDGDVSDLKTKIQNKLLT